MLCAPFAQAQYGYSQSSYYGAIALVVDVQSVLDDRTVVLREIIKRQVSGALYLAVEESAESVLSAAAFGCRGRLGSEIDYWSRCLRYWSLVSSLSVAVSASALA